MKASREAENLSVPLYAGGIKGFDLEEAEQRGLGMLHQGHSSNSKKIHELVVNRILLQQDQSGPDVFLKLLQNTGWEWNQADKSCGSNT